MSASRNLAALCLSAALFAMAPAFAQDAAREVVLPVENVRYDYAQVLSVRPVYQTLRTTRDGAASAIRASPPISATAWRG